MSNLQEYEQGLLQLKQALQGKDRRVRDEFVALAEQLRANLRADLVESREAATLFCLEARRLQTDLNLERLSVERAKIIYRLNELAHAHTGASFHEFWKQLDRQRRMPTGWELGWMWRLRRSFRSFIEARSGRGRLRMSLQHDVDYEQGVQRLRQRIQDRDSDVLSQFAALAERLRANLDDKQLYGDTSDQRAEQAAIILELNLLGLRHSSVTFTELCKCLRDPGVKHLTRPGHIDYERGSRRLYTLLQGADQRVLAEAATLDLQLRATVEAERRYGSTLINRAEQARLLQTLDRLAAQHAGTRFVELCSGS